jgi:phage gpG-like protein
MTELRAELSVADLKKIQRNLEQIAERMENGDLLSRVGLLVERQAKKNASGRPGPRVQTGRLRASITLRLQEGRPVREAVVGTNVVYAPPVEFGHKQEVGRFVPIYAMRMIRTGQFRGRYEVSRGLGVRLVKPFAPAYPFMRPALEQVQSSGEMDGVIASFGTDIQREWLT